MPYGKATDKNLIDQKMRRLKPGDFILMANGTIENIAVRAGSNCQFGHALLYVGKNSAMELPLKTASVDALMRKYQTTGVAFIHCKRLTSKQRQDIMTAARAFAAVKKAQGSDGYSVVGTALHGLGSVLSTSAELITNEVVGRVATNPKSASTQTKLASFHAALRQMTAAPAGVVNLLQAKMLKTPNLSCSGLVTWCHAVAGNTIVKGKLRDPHTASPRDLWFSSNSNVAKYSIDVAMF